MSEAKTFRYHRDPNRIIEGWPQQRYALSGLYELCLFLKKRIPLHWMCELGSAYGESTVVFAQFFQWVTAVDEWKIKEDPTMPDPEKVFDECVQRHGIFKIKGHTRVAAFVGAERSLDFLYIDADHRFDAVAGDIMCWLPKMKRHRFIGGHDWMNPYCMGVTLAVKYLFGKPYRTFPDGSWVVKV